MAEKRILKVVDLGNHETMATNIYVVTIATIVFLFILVVN